MDWDRFINFSSSSKIKGYDLFLRALKEEKNYIEHTFYEKEFGLIVRKINAGAGKTIMKGNTLPGIISFLYYTGSPVFLMLSIALIFFIFNFLENFLRYSTNNNLVFYLLYFKHDSNKTISFWLCTKRQLYVFDFYFTVYLIFKHTNEV